MRKSWWRIATSARFPFAGAVVGLTVGVAVSFIVVICLYDSQQLKIRNADPLATAIVIVLACICALSGTAGVLQGVRFGKAADRWIGPTPNGVQAGCAV